jgi:zinc D-Ala-D-Ala dipeptidase
LGKPINGYTFDEAILKKEAALALSKVQIDLLADGFSLVIYDAFRPQKAVDEFIIWSSNHSDQLQKAKYYPYIDKKDVFKLGYVAKKSGHTGGDTLDLTIIKTTQNLKSPIKEKDRMLQNGRIIKFLDDGTVDMGTSLDLFGPASHHDTDLITYDHTLMRNYLRQKMSKYGFDPYPYEWWHYTFRPNCNLWCLLLKFF